MNATTQLDDQNPKVMQKVGSALRPLWRLTRPAIILVGAALVGLALAILLRTMILPILDTIGNVLSWIVQKFGSWFSDLQKPPELNREKSIDIGITAFGLVVVLSTLKDTHDCVTKVVLKWMSADREVLLPAFSSVVVAFTALGLSVYALGELTNKPPVTVAFDAAMIPPAVVDPDKGDVTFYVSFQAEGGRASLTDPKHSSVNLRQLDRDFLERLGQGLRTCTRGSESDKPLVTTRGFASGSLWTSARSEIEAMLREDPSNATLATAVETVNTYAENDETRERELAFARGFNVYLANKRRAAVVDVLRLHGGEGIRLVGNDWNSYPDMDNALAIDDRGVGQQAAAAGILTRSVAITIHAGGCSRATRYSRVELAVAR